MGNGINMGFETDWKLEVKGGSALFQDEIDAVMEISTYDWWDSTDERVLEMTAKWYDWERHMLLISAKFPDRLFILNGIGEDHTHYPKNAKFQNGKQLVKETKVNVGKEILKIKFKSSDLNKTLTIKQYLKTLLSTVFEESEGFSGKRPFGNSGWEHDLEVALVKSGHLKGKLDDDGYLESVEKGFDELIQLAIKAL